MSEDVRWGRDGMERRHELGAERETGGECRSDATESERDGRGGGGSSFSSGGLNRLLLSLLVVLLPRFSSPSRVYQVPTLNEFVSLGKRQQ